MEFTIIADKNIDLTETKKCKRCEEKGQPSVHPVNDFSIKTDGKRHSYCKKCRAADTKEWTEARAEYRAQYQRDYRAKRRTKVYHGNVYKRRANKPVLPNVVNTNFANAVEVSVVNGELVPVAKFQHLYFAFNCGAVHIAVRQK